MIRIGIDTQSTQGKKAGLGVFTENFTNAVKEMAPAEWKLFFYQKPVSGDMNTPDRLIWENWHLPRIAARDKVKLLHTPAFAPPLCPPCRTVVTVHDLIGMIFPNQLGWPSRFYWGKWLPWTAKRANAIIADSEHTKKDILERLRVPESKIFVIYPSGHENFGVVDRQTSRPLLEKLGLTDRPYFLCVGTLEPRKNLKRVIQAFLQFSKKNPDFKLMIVGSKNFAHGRVFKSLISQTDPASTGNIYFTGYLSHEELNSLYSGAQAFLYPSLYEGFGIPVLEAMACGTPVITSNGSSLPEVAGEAACRVDPNDTQAIVQTMDQLSGESRYRSELIEKGFHQIKKFSWKQTAAQTLKVYETLL